MLLSARSGRTIDALAGCSSILALKVSGQPVHEHLSPSVHTLRGRIHHIDRYRMSTHSLRSLIQNICHWMLPRLKPPAGSRSLNDTMHRSWPAAAILAGGSSVMSANDRSCSSPRAYQGDLGHGTGAAASQGPFGQGLRAANASFSTTLKIDEEAVLVLDCWDVLDRWTRPSLGV